MSRICRRRPTALASAAVVAVGLVAVPPASAGAVSRARLTGQHGYLTGVVAPSARSVWAVGFPASGPGTTIDRRLGTVWRRVDSPPGGSTTGQLADVAAVSRGNLWAVGAAGAGTLTAHWTGRRWVRVPSPSPGRDAHFAGISAVSRRYLWAVGSHLNRAQENSAALIEHWNGSRWGVVPSPRASDFDALADVAALSRRDAWAVGSTTLGTLVAHWNGRRWRRVPSPGRGELSSVSAVSATSVWTVGDDGGQTMVLHWNGTRWRTAKVPHPGRFSVLSGVDAVSAHNVWAVGWVQPRGSQLTRTLALHWNGTRWQVVPSPNVASRTSLLAAVDARAGGGAWAVGYSGVGSNTRVVAMRWSEHRWHLA
jgi:hypothetical protein